MMGWISDASDVLVRLAARVGQSAWRLIRADHTSLYGGWFTRPDHGGRQHFYISFGCAPSRRKLPGWSVTPMLAREFTDDAFPSAFPSKPTWSSREAVSFEVPGEEGGDPFVRAVRVYPTGRVELTWRVSTDDRDDGVLVLSVLEIIRPVRQLAEAVSRGSYGRLFSLWRKLDWFVGLSPDISAPGGRRSWDDLSFPAARPRDRATRGVPVMPSEGYAAGALRGRRQRTDPLKLLRLVLSDLLLECGYDGYDEAVQQTLRALPPVT